MKKLVSLLLALALIFSLCACGAKEEQKPEVKSNALTEILDKGFSMRGYTYDTEGGFKALIVKETAEGDCDYSEVYKAEASMTQDDCDALDAIPWDAEDSDEQKIAYLSGLSDMTVTDITQFVPTQADVDALVGKTFGELEEMGFYNSGWTQTDDMTSYDFYYDGPIFYGKFSLPEDVKIANMDDYSENDIRALTIGGVEFLGISFDIVYAE